MTCENGVKNKGLRKTYVITQHGLLEYTRTALCGKFSSLKDMIGSSYVFPKDILLKTDNLPYHMTCERMLHSTLEAIRARSFEEASLRLIENLHYSSSISHIWKIANYIGFIVLQERNKRTRILADAFANGTLPEAIDKYYSHVEQVPELYSLVDGSMVDTRPDCPKEAKENESNWRECKMAMAFRPSDLKLRKSGENGEERFTIEKASYDAFIGSVEDFKFIWLDLLLRNGVKPGTTVVHLSDGADWIYRMAHDLLEPLGVKLIAINDLFHTKENIGTFCKYVNDKISDCKKRYSNPEMLKGLEKCEHNNTDDLLFYNSSYLSADNIIFLVEEGNIEEALSLLEPFKDLKVSKQGVVNAYKYIDERRMRMQYPLYRSMGYYVGSGPVESANKYYIQIRMKGPGMEWSIACGQRILILRGYYVSDNWVEVESIIYGARDRLMQLKAEFEAEETARRAMRSIKRE